jgi:hypothetical protein
VRRFNENDLLGHVELGLWADLDRCTYHCKHHGKNGFGTMGYLISGLLHLQNARFGLFAPAMDLDNTKHPSTAETLKVSQLRESRYGDENFYFSEAFLKGRIVGPDLKKSWVHRKK